MQELLVEAVKNQLWMNDEYRLSREAYCQGQACFYGVFNFMAVYGGGHNDLRYTGNREPQVAKGELNIYDIMEKTYPIGEYISRYDPYRVSFNPDVPFHWGNNLGYYEAVKLTVRGNSSNQILYELPQDFVIYTINQWITWFK